MSKPSRLPDPSKNSWWKLPAYPNTPPVYRPSVAAHRVVAQPAAMSRASVPVEARSLQRRPTVHTTPLHRAVLPPAARAFPAVQPKRSGAAGVILRYCGTPGCNDPTCNDPRNHGFEIVRTLRGRTQYVGDIRSSDIGQGTGTNKTTRDYVNSSTTTYPQQVSIEYTPDTSQKGMGGHSEFINEPLAPGQRADAGHIFGNQYGGYGNQTASVFPQHPQTNRGNYYQGEPTRDLWRAQEDEVRRLAQQGHTVRNTVTLRDESRTYYGNGCRRCDHANPRGVTKCQKCGSPL